MGNDEPRKEFTPSAVETKSGRQEHDLLRARISRALLRRLCPGDWGCAQLPLRGHIQRGAGVSLGAGSSSLLSTASPGPPLAPRGEVPGCSPPLHFAPASPLPFFRASIDRTAPLRPTHPCQPLRGVASSVFQHTNPSQHQFGAGGSRGKPPPPVFVCVCVCAGGSSPPHKSPGGFVGAGSGRRCWSSLSSAGIRPKSLPLWMRAQRFPSPVTGMTDLPGSSGAWHLGRAAKPAFQLRAHTAFFPFFFFSFFFFFFFFFHWGTFSSAFPSISPPNLNEHFFQ